MKTMTIQYRIRMPDSSEEVFDLVLDEKNLELVGNIQEDKPEWTRLDHHQCSHCPLVKETYPHCPIATNLSPVVSRFSSILSHDDIYLLIITKERRISQHTTAQKGISALMGLVMATSGCPHTVFFKPMARFHLPLASTEETIYRATSMYMLAQYFLKDKGGKVDMDFEGLKELYRNMQLLNTAFAGRLREATEKDSSINAIVNLDMYAKAMPYVIEDALEEIRYLFTSYL